MNDLNILTQAFLESKNLFEQRRKNELAIVEGIKQFKELASDMIDNYQDILKGEPLGMSGEEYVETIDQINALFANLRIAFDNYDELHYEECYDDSRD